MTLTGFQLDEPLIPGSPEWLATYSASQVAAIVGLSDWDTPRSMYDAKKGIVPSQPQTDVQSRGHYWEPHIRQWVADANPDWTVETTGTWRHAVREWQTANPDAIVITPDPTELLQIKTDQNIHEWGGVLPMKYRIQVMWEMDVTGAKRCHVAACGPFELFNRKPKMFVVDYDPRDAAVLRERVLAFDADLRAGIQPPADHTMAPDRLAVRYANTAIVDDPGVDIPDELAIPYLEPYAEAADVEARKKSGGSALLEYLGQSKTARYKGVVIATRVNGKGDNPPSLRATNGLADKAANLLDTRKAA